MKQAVYNKRKLKATRKAVKELIKLQRTFISQCRKTNSVCIIRVEGFSFYKLNLPVLPAILAVIYIAQYYTANITIWWKIYTLYGSSRLKTKNFDVQKTLQKHLSLQHEDNMEGLSTYMNYPRLAYSRRQLPMALSSMLQIINGGLLILYQR